MHKQISIIFFLVSTLSFTQVSFQKSYGDSGDEKAFSVTELKDSTFVVAGVTTSYSSDKDVILMNFDSLGVALWTRTLRGDKIDVGRQITATDDGGMVVSGSTASFGAGRRDIFVAKLDKKGNTEWAKAYGGEQNEYAFAVHPTIDGGYIIAGETASFGVSQSDILVMKLDSRGNEKWSMTIGGKNVEYAFDVMENPDGYLVGFETNSWGVGQKDVGLVKIDKLGNYQWMRTYGGPKEENVNAMLTLKDGSFALTGITASFGYGNLDGFLIKCSKAGELEYARTYGEVGAEILQGIIETEDGFVFSGFSNSYNDQLLAEDMLLIRVNEKGRTRWSKTYGGTFSDVGLDMLRTSKNEILVVGETKSFSGRSDSDIYILKNSDDGALTTCEQSRVQAIDQPAEFVMEKNEPEISKIKVQINPADFENLEQLIPDINICTEGETLVNERKTQLQQSKGK